MGETMGEIMGELIDGRISIIEMIYRRFIIKY